MRDANAASQSKNSIAHVEHLESRVLYSADILGILAPTDVDVIDDEHTISTLIGPVEAPAALDEDSLALELAAYDSMAAPLVDTSALVVDTSVPVVDTTSAKPVSEMAGDFDIESAGLLRTIQSVSDNESPTLTGFPADNAVYIETGAAVLLGPDLVVSDPELDLANNYNGFKVKIERIDSATTADQFDLGERVAGNQLFAVDGSSALVGTVLQNSNGVLELVFNGNATQQIVQNTLRSISYFNTDVSDEPSQFQLLWTVDDGNTDGSQGSGGEPGSTYNTTISIVPSSIKAVDDDLGVVVAGQPLSIAESALLANDTGLLASTAEIVNVTQPLTGTLSDTFVYTSEPDDTGLIDFEYTAMAGNSSLISQWPLVEDGADNVGSNSGTVISDSAGELIFNGDDYIELPSIVYPDTFALSFDFKINDLENNDREEVFFAHGEFREKNTLMVWATGSDYETGFDRGKMWTFVRDNNEALRGNGYGIDITGLDNQWHNYTIVVELGVGTKIWIDGDLKVVDTGASGPFQPTLPAYIGVEYDSDNSDEFVYHLTDHQMANLRLLDGFDGSLNEFSTATVSLDLRNEEVLEQSSFSVDEDEIYQVPNTELLTTDIDNTDDELVYKITSEASVGSLLLNAVELSTGDYFTQQDVNLGNVYFRHDGNESAIADSMDLIVDDGEGSSTAVDLQISITPVNDAPVLTDGVLDSIDEGNTSPVGEVISRIFNGAFTDNDPSGFFEGIAIAANADDSHGAWEYSTDNGGNWHEVGLVSESAALLLKRNAYLRFAPDTNFHGNTPDLTIYAVDNSFTGWFTEGSTKVAADVTTRGGSTPLSETAATINSSVHSINDAPTLGDGSLADLEEDDTNSAGELISDIFSGQFSDEDSDGGFAGIAVGGNVSSTAGAWQYSAGVGGWTDFEPVSLSQAVLLDTSSRLRFVPAEDYNGSVPALQVYAIDNTFGGSFSSAASQESKDITSRGDGTPFSTLSAEVSVSINAVFDPPRLVGVLPAISVEEDVATDIDLSGLRVDPGDWGGPLRVHIKTSNGGVLSALDGNSELITGSSLLVAGVDSSALNNYLDTNRISYLHEDANHHGDSADTFTIRLVFSSDSLAGRVSADVDIAGVNDLPVLEGYGSPLISAYEDQLTEVTLDDLQADSTDVEDLTIASFQVQEVLNGILYIGSEVFQPDVNDTIDAGHIGYWRPALNDNGLLDAFVVRGIDSNGGVSEKAEIVRASIEAVNDPPELNGYDNPLVNTLEDTAVELTLTELAGTSKDVEDGMLSALIVQPGDISGELEIGMIGDLNPYIEGTNDRIDADTIALWTPPANESGEISAFSVRGMDGDGLLSATAETVIADVTAVNDRPTLVENVAPYPLIAEDTTTEFRFDMLIAAMRGFDVEGDIDRIVIDSVPDEHTLSIGPNSGDTNEFEAGVNDTIDLDNHVYWTPKADLSDTVTEAFTLHVKDSQGLGSEVSAVFNVRLAGVNDAPVLNSNIEPFPLVHEDHTLELTLADLISEINGEDIDGEIESVIVDSVADEHRLRIGVNATQASVFKPGINDTIDGSNRAFWTPMADFSGSAIEAFTVWARDDAGRLSDSTATIKLDVLPVNDAPVAIDSTVSVVSGTSYRLGAGDFGFEDRLEGDALSSVQVTGLPDIGQLLYLDTPVVAGQELAIEVVADGQLLYVPPLRIDTESVATQIEFKVRDSGGTLNDGVDQSEDSGILKLDIVAIDLPPVISGSELLPFRVAENSPSGTVAGPLAAIEPDPVFFHLNDGDFGIGARDHVDVTRFSAEGEWFGSSIGSWDVVSGNVDLRGDLWQPGPDGGYPLDLNGDRPAVIEQQIVTQADAHYRLEFALAGNFRSSDTEAIVEVTVADQTTLLTVEKSAGWSEDNVSWQRHSIPFIASDTTTTVSFRSLDDGAHGPLITDVKIHDELVFELRDPDIPFRIDSDNGLITTDGLLDYETQASYSIEVNVSVPGGSSSLVSYPVEIMDVNESPVQSANNRLQAIVGTASVISSELLMATDVDAADRSPDSVVYTLKNANRLGQLYLGDSELSSGDHFSQADIDQQRLSYVGRTSGEDSFTFELADGGEDGAAAVEGEFVVSTYEPLVMRANSTWQLAEGESVPLSVALIDTAGGYYDDQDLLIEVSRKPDTVNFLNLESGTTIDRFSKEAINNGAVVVQHDGSEPGADALTVDLILHRIHQGVPLFVDSASIDLYLTDVANAPIGADSEMTTDHATELTISVEQLGFNDGADGDSLKAISIVQTPATGTLSIDGKAVETGTVIDVASIRQGRLVYSPDPSTVGSVIERVEFHLVDSGDTRSGGTNVSTHTNSIDIRIVSDHPAVAQPDTIVLDEGGVVSILESGGLSLIDNDTDLDTSKNKLRVVLEDEPLHGELILREDGTFTYQHDRSETISDRFSYRILIDELQEDAGSGLSSASDSVVGEVRESGVDSAKAWVNIIINPVDDHPIAGVVENQSVIAGRYFEFNLPDDLFRPYYPGDELVLSVKQADGSVLPVWLNFDPHTGLFSGVPPLYQIDSLEIQVTATDTDFASSQLVFSVNIEPSIEEASESVADPVPPKTIAQSTDVTVQPTVSTEPVSIATQSSVVSRDNNAGEQPPQTDATVRFVAYHVNEQRDILSEFDDKIVKHIDKKIVRVVPELIAIVEDPLDTQDLRELYVSGDNIKASTAKRIIDQLDNNREQLASSADSTKVVFNGAASVSVGLSISYFLWLLKSGALLSSALSAMPAWRLIDPVPILQDSGVGADGEDESLESMVEETNQPDLDKSKDLSANGDRTSAWKFWSRKSGSA